VAAFLQVITTTDSEEEAERIAAALVERRLAACVQVLGPISSHYHWQGELEAAREWICLAKTTEETYTRLEEAIRELHSYEEPEIVGMAVAAGSRGYLDWVSRNVGG
jgi:periplasmic divalent cation tolerance protein